MKGSHISGWVWVAFLAAACAASAYDFKNWDTDGDGSLAGDEIKPWVRGSLLAFDADNDKAISREEFAQFVAKSFPGGTRILEDQQYGSEDNWRQTLDLFLPPVDGDKPLPLVVYIHGGGWQNGDKRKAVAWGVPVFLKAGFAAASINYRLSDEAQWPAQLHDCKAAIRWLRAHAREHGIDPNRIGVFGESAGGHLVSMLGVTNEDEMKEGSIGMNRFVKGSVSCVLDIFGPTDLLKLGREKAGDTVADKALTGLFGGPLEQNILSAKDASPINYVSRDDVPFLILHGTEDALVPYTQSVEFAAALKRAGVPVSMISVLGANHQNLRSEDLDARMVNFFKRNLMKQTDAVVDETPIEFTKNGK